MLLRALFHALIVSFVASDGISYQRYLNNAMFHLRANSNHLKMEKWRSPEIGYFGNENARIFYSGRNRKNRDRSSLRNRI